ncbi:hypothetical protein F7734_07770 [Scytonema sp. UIC 10036]|uniref:hypothetical protein n=1 Tax=Scytonema sp. UIC 10036 TaxID=2304196 RepID=UPI0012DA27A9|nr:hypothetical protein [Scytonema sp. UIC 10036]MUG92357.1 hypothetical protein [Scytonema sp. UIC 10036]
MSDKIIYPSIDLFLYDLKDGLGQDELKIDQNCRDFCHKIYNALDEESFEEKYKQIQKHKNTDADVIELLETRRKEFQSPLDGYYYPLKLGDTYALQVDYSGKEDANGRPNDSEQELDDEPFLKLKQEIEKQISYEVGTLGQTWLAWGKLTEKKSDSEIEKIAKNCYIQLVKNYNWDRDFIGKGQWFGGTIFELWYCPENVGLTGKEFWEKFRRENHHVLIWLFPDDQSPDEMRQKLNSVYYDLLRLFQYRHKVVWSYYQSRHQKYLLKKEYIEIQPSINLTSYLSRQLQTNKLKLNQLQKILTDNLINLADYTIALNYLENQRRTIKVNLGNYKYRLDAMLKKYPGSNLDCLKFFSDSDIYAQKYQRQIEADYENLSPGFTLLENLNSTIQGIINLEQTKSDRALDNTIAIASVGLAISGLTATVATAHNPPPKSYTDLSFLLSPAFVLSIAFSAPFLIALLVRLFRR